MRSRYCHFFFEAMDDERKMQVFPFFDGGQVPQSFPKAQWFAEQHIQLAVGDGSVGCNEESPAGTTGIIYRYQQKFFGETAVFCNDFIHRLPERKDFAKHYQQVTKMPADAADDLSGL